MPRCTFGVVLDTSASMAHQVLGKALGAIASYARARDVPILVITDGQCDMFRVRREHALLVPEGARLPFTPRGPVFHIS